MLQSGALSHFWDKVFYIDITIGKENYYETDDECNHVLDFVCPGYSSRRPYCFWRDFLSEKTQKQEQEKVIENKSEERRDHHEPTGIADFDFSIARNKRRFVCRINYRLSSFTKR